VCPNYDLCSSCEAKNDHPSDHTLLKLKERKGANRGCGRGFGRFGHPGHPRGFGHHGFGHPGGFGHHGHPGGFGHHGFGHPGGFGHQGRHEGFGRGFGLHRLFKGFSKVFGLNKWGEEKKCDWSKKCRRSESVQPGCHRAEPEQSQGSCRRSKSVQGWGKCHGRGFKHHSKHGRNLTLHAKFIQDSNFADGCILAPGSTVTKQWRIKNVGSVAWPEGSKLIFLRGNREILGEVEEFAVPLAKPDEAVEVSCPINVPGKAGHYSAYFKLADKDRAVFGQRFWIEFDVKEDLKKFEAKKEVIVEEKEDTKKLPQGLDTTAVQPLYPVISDPKPVVIQKPAEVSKYASALGVLEKMGFINEKLNAGLLEKSKGNVEQVVAWLLEMEHH